MNESADLPKSAWVMHSGDTHITNDRSLLRDARDCDESLYGQFGNSMRAQAIGEVHLELYNNRTLHLKSVRFVPTAKYNLISDKVLAREVSFTINFGSQNVLLRMMDQSGAETRFEGAKTVGGKFVFLTKQPTIDEVIEFAREHPTPDSEDCLSTYTQDSDIGKYHRNA